MAYAAALSKAWAELKALTEDNNFKIRFMDDDYAIDLKEKRVLSVSCNSLAKDHYSILILHYLCQKIKGLSPMQGVWISFKELPGGQAYYPTYKKRVLETILRKYKDNPEALLELNQRFPCRSEKLADISVVLEAMQEVQTLITFWRGDEEFGPEANVLFDKNINEVFCTEDIVVLAEIIAHKI
ncbi:MAG: DUF3786 domain-containing protein [Candidatus Omnitrophica bacterium]|nr:DUF3786 domain-containing protein [Candidatus Omnitrophota bacterium]